MYTYIVYSQGLLGQGVCVCVTWQDLDRARVEMAFAKSQD